MRDHHSSATVPPGPRLDAWRERQLAKAWESLLGRTDAIADDLALKLLAHEPTYAHGGPEMQAELRASCREHISRGVRTMAGLAEPGEEAVHVWRETGRLRARQGVPMDVVLRAYSVGCRALWEGLLEQCRNGDADVDEQMLVLAGQSIWRSLDVQTATLVEAYRSEHARLQLRDLQRQHSLLDGLAEGRGADPTFAQEVCDVLGFAPDSTLLCVVAPIDDPRTEPLRGADDRLDRSGLLSHWHVRARTHFGIVAVGDRTLAELVELLRPCVAGRAAVARMPDGLAGFVPAYRLAARAASTLEEGTPRLVTLEERLPEVLLAGSPELGPALVGETIGPLLALPQHQRDLLLDTLAALLDHDGSPTHAARQLYCHRNTVIYRLRQIEELTGRRIHDSRDKLLLVLGLAASGRALPSRAAAG